jgi:hypothetical protein
MTKNQKLELTWVGKENRPRLEPRLRLIEDSQLHSAANFSEAVLQVCGEPRCGCTMVLIQFEPSVPPGDIWFDLEETKPLPSPEQERDPEFPRLAEMIRTELAGANQMQLREWFLAEKLEVIETSPLSKIDVANLPDASGGAMIGFVDVFPLGVALHFTFEQEVWCVDDQYCVQPDCNCKETALSFLKPMKASERKATVIRDSPAVRYNYRTQTISPVARGPQGSPSCDVLIEAFRAAHPDLDLRLELHHLIMQSLYARLYLEQNRSRLKSLASAASSKIGRNEPCPCGSGRKFKHCCLNKSPAQPSAQ